MRLKFAALLMLIMIAKATMASSYSIGTEDIEYFPHYGKSSPHSNEFEGFARLLFDDFSSKMNFDILYTLQPIKRLYFSLLINKTIDFKYPDSPLWNSAFKKESLQKIYYSKPIINYVDGTFVHKKNINLPYKDIKTLGVVRGFTAVPFADDIASGKIRMVEYARSDHLIKALEAERIDAIYINTKVATYQIEDKNINLLSYRADLPNTEGEYRLSTTEHPEIIELLDKYLIENPSTINELKNKFGL